MRKSVVTRLLLEIQKKFLQCGVQSSFTGAQEVS